MKAVLLTGIAGILVLPGCQSTSSWPGAGSEPSDPYAKAIALTAGMDGSRKAERLARRHGLEILDLTWEDTARYYGSAVGPNISEMTIQVARDDEEAGELEVVAMPVIRFPNFSDKTADLDPRDFTLLVGSRHIALARGLVHRVALSRRQTSLF